MRDESAHQHPLGAIIRAQTQTQIQTQTNTQRANEVKWLARISVGGQNGRLFDYGEISDTERRLRRQLCGVSATNDRP